MSKVLKLTRRQLALLVQCSNQPRGTTRAPRYCGSGSTLKSLWEKKLINILDDDIGHRWVMITQKGKDAIS